MVANNGSPEGEAAVPNERGRPSIYVEAVATELIERIAGGETLRGICRSDDKFPSPATVRRWVIEDTPKGFSERYAKARESGIHEMIDQTVMIADDSRKDTETRYDAEGNAYEAPDHEWIARSRLRVDTRKWLASKVLPKLYGDRLEVETKGTVTHEVGDSIAGLISRIRTVRNVTPEADATLVEPGGSMVQRKTGV